MPLAIRNDSNSLTEAARFLMERGYCGLVWLDADLVVRQRAGSLVDFVELGQPVGETIVALYGCDEDIKQMRIGERRRFELANARIIGPDGEGLRLNFYLHWLATSDRFLLVVLRTTAQGEIEAALENERRVRALVEAKSIEQAKALEKANADLVRVNRELSEFANIIAHDLKSPMRELRYQAEDIERALGESNIDDAVARLDDLKRQARRMSRMLTDLLVYARIGHTQEAITNTDTRALAEAIIASLPRPRGFLIELTGNWPVVETVEPELDMVLRNLIDNAIKHHDRKDGHITLDGRPTSTGLEIMVTDDGPGILPRFHNAIFQPFRKLASDAVAETAGSGIGLSLVRKAVASAGATIVIVSDPAERRGTAFQLTWPCQIETA